MKNAFLATVCLSFIAACAPTDGPSTTNVVNNAKRQEIPILQINDNTLRGLGDISNGSGLVSLASGSYLPGVIKPGDTISVTLFDTGETGMFEVGSSGSLALGEYTVSNNGTVDLPFAGALNIGGRSAAAAQSIITRKLRENSVNPSASVSISRKETDRYSVQGAVGTPGVFSLSAAQERVLQGIALAGGSNTAPEDTLVTLIRGGNRASQPLSDVISEPNANISLLPGDTIIVGGGAANFIAEGALVSTGDFDFVEGGLTLAKAISMAGGLQNSRANPRSVFVLRQLAPGESFVVEDTAGNRRTITESAIFRANYRDPSEILRANKFLMKDGDVLYVGDAPLAKFAKFFQIFESPPEIPKAPEPPSF